MIPGHVTHAVSKALFMLPPAMTSREARVMLYAIGLQESRFEDRRQVIKKDGRLQPIGPAKSLWQMERGGGCVGVVTHAASRFWMHHVCMARGVKFNSTALWKAIETDDVLAAAAARLLLFTDPKRLPEVGDEQGAWNLYKRVWRPGALKRDYAGLRKKWTGNYAEAMGALA